MREQMTGKLNQHMEQFTAAHLLATAKLTESLVAFSTRCNENMAALNTHIISVLSSVQIQIVLIQHN